MRLAQTGQIARMRTSLIVGFLSCPGSMLFDTDTKIKPKQYHSARITKLVLNSHSMLNRTKFYSENQHTLVSSTRCEDTKSDEMTVYKQVRHLYNGHYI